MPPPGSRSWTDATTNSIFYRGLDSAAYLRWLARRNLSGAHLVGQFLHEFTHHWCNRTLLGAALAMIELRLSLFTEAHPRGRPIWARDLVAHRTITNLLRPMFEGLAQIAEYDLTHIDDEAHTGTPLGASVLCFGVAGDDQFRHAMLQHLRHSDELLERKASLYFRKFEVEDGYLPGYMAAKNAAWSIVGRGYNVPIEIFLAYMRSYFWDDPELIKILVSEEMDGSKVVESLHRRFSDRFLDLFHAKDLPERIQSFRTKWTPDEPARCAVELGCAEQEFAVAIERIGMLEQHFHTMVDNDTAAVERVAGISADQIHALLPSIADSRRYALVASATVVVEQDGGITLTGEGEAETPAPELADYVTLPPGRYELAVVVPTFGTFLGVLATDEQGNVTPLLEIQAEGCDDGIRQSTLRFVSNRHALHETMERLRTRFFEVGIEVVESKVVSEISAWSYEQASLFYAAAACARILDQEKARAAREVLLKQGLKPVFAKDTVAARLVAGMSMLSGTDQWMQQNPDRMVGFARLYYLPEYEEEDLRKRLDAVLARDQDGLVLRQADEFLLTYV